MLKGREWKTDKYKKKKEQTIGVVQMYSTKILRFSFT